MDTEIQRFKEAVEAVVAMLRRNKHLTSDEEDTITAETGRVRSELAGGRSVQRRGGRARAAEADRRTPARGVGDTPPPRPPGSHQPPPHTSTSSEVSSRQG